MASELFEDDTRNSYGLALAGRAGLTLAAPRLYFGLSFLHFSGYEETRQKRYANTLDLADRRAQLAHELGGSVSDVNRVRARTRFTGGKTDCARAAEFGYEFRSLRERLLIQPHLARNVAQAVTIQSATLATPDFDCAPAVLVRERVGRLAVSHWSVHPPVAAMFFWPLVAFPEKTVPRG